MSRKSIIRLALALFLLAAISMQHKTQTPSLPSISPTPTNSVLGVMTKTSACITDGTLPDSNCTPGAIDPSVTQENIHTTICVSGYTKTVRPAVSITNKIKTQVMAAYNDVSSPKDFELDHLVSLELGGCPDCVANLWPEPYNISFGAHEKDNVENYLNKQVCDGNLSLSQAQTEIARNWKNEYMKLYPGTIGN